MLRILTSFRSNIACPAAPAAFSCTPDCRRRRRRRMFKHLYILSSLLSNLVLKGRTGTPWRWRITYLSSSLHIQHSIWGFGLSVLCAMRRSSRYDYHVRPSRPLCACALPPISFVLWPPGRRCLMAAADAIDADESSRVETRPTDRHTVRSSSVWLSVHFTAKIRNLLFVRSFVVMEFLVPPSPHLTSSLTPSSTRLDSSL